MLHIEYNEHLSRRIARLPEARKTELLDLSDNIWNLMKGLHKYEVEYILYFIQQNQMAYMQVVYTPYPYGYTSTKNNDLKDPQ